MTNLPYSSTTISVGDHHSSDLRGSKSCLGITLIRVLRELKNLCPPSDQSTQPNHFCLSTRLTVIRYPPGNSCCQTAAALAHNDSSHKHPFGRA